MKKFSYRTFFSILIICFTVYGIWSLFKQELQIYHINKKIVEINDMTKKEEIKHKALLDEKEALGHDDYIEKVAREDLGMTKPGEIPYIPTHKKK